MMRSSFPSEQKHLRQNTGFISTGVERILSGLVCHQTQEGGNRVLVTQHPGSAPASPELLCCNHVAAAMSPAAVPEPLPNRGSQLRNCPTESDIRNIEFSRKLCLSECDHSPADLTWLTGQCSRPGSSKRQPRFHETDLCYRASTETGPALPSNFPGSLLPTEMRNLPGNPSAVLVPVEPR